LRLVSDEPGAAGEQRDLVSRLRAVIGAKDEQIAALASALEASLARERLLELRLAEVERRLLMDSTDSGTPSSKERIGRGSSPSGSGGRIASEADSPAIRGKA
jgi:hypothetical protein